MAAPDERELEDLARAALESDEGMARLKAHAHTEAARIFDEPRLGEAAFRIAECCEQLSREERAVLLLFTLLPTLGKVAEPLQVDVVVTAMATVRHGTEVGAGLWREVAQRYGVRTTSNPPTV